MNYKALYEYVRDISQNIDITTQFFHGRKEITTLLPLAKPLLIYCLPFQSTGSLTNGVLQTNESWQLTIMFLQQDQADSAIDQNDTEALQAEMEILTVCENAATKFLHYFNENLLTDELSEAADQLTINSFTKTPAIKDTMMLTGIILTMNVTVGDSFNYCC